MAKGNKAIAQEAYNVIYDFVMNKSLNREIYNALWKKEQKCGGAIAPAEADLFNLLYELRASIRYSTAKENGTGNLHKVIEKLIKHADDRPALQGIYRSDNGYTYYTNSYILFKTEEELDLPHIKDCSPIAYDKIIPDIRDMREVEVPTTAELKQYMKLNKNNKELTRLNNVVYFVRNESGEAVAMFNAKLLTQCREGIGDTAKCYVQKGTKSQICPLVMVTDKTTALVVPMRDYDRYDVNWECA